MALEWDDKGFAEVAQARTPPRGPENAPEPRGPLRIQTAISDRLGPGSESLESARAKTRGLPCSRCFANFLCRNTGLIQSPKACAEIGSSPFRKAKCSDCPAEITTYPMMSLVISYFIIIIFFYTALAAR